MQNETSVCGSREQQSSSLCFLAEYTDHLRKPWIQLCRQLLISSDLERSVFFWLFMSLMGNFDFSGPQMCWRPVRYLKTHPNCHPYFLILQRRKWKSPLFPHSGIRTKNSLIYFPYVFFSYRT